MNHATPVNMIILPEMKTLAIIVVTARLIHLGVLGMKLYCFHNLRISNEYKNKRTCRRSN